ncbi:MAG: response regulator [Thaumarchaeota archaeon]|nr:response regulator [Nitrososphaerota archaeon]
MENTDKKEGCTRMALKILVAEDSTDLAETYRMALESRGHVVISARDGIECLQTYSDNLKKTGKDTKSFVDVVILDQQMPGMDGIDVAREIQKVNPKQRIIFITGYGFEVIKKLRELTEEVEVMNKPFTLKALVIQIEGWSLYSWRENARKGFRDWDGYTGTSVPVGPSRST